MGPAPDVEYLRIPGELLFVENTAAQTCFGRTVGGMTEELLGESP